MGGRGTRSWRALRESARCAGPSRNCEPSRKTSASEACRGAARSLLEKLARQLLDLSTAEELVQLVEGGRPEWWTPVLVERFLEQPDQAIERGQAQQEAPAPGLA